MLHHHDMTIFSAKKVFVLQNCWFPLKMNHISISSLDHIMQPEFYSSACSFYSVTVISLWVTVSPYKWVSSRPTQTSSDELWAADFTRNPNIREKSIMWGTFWKQGLIFHTGCADVPNGSTNNTLHFNFLTQCVNQTGKNMLLFTCNKKTLITSLVFGVHVWPVKLHPGALIADKVPLIISQPLRFMSWPIRSYYIKAF